MPVWAFERRASILGFSSHILEKGQNGIMNEGHVKESGLSMLKKVLPVGDLGGIYYWVAELAL